MWNLLSIVREMFRRNDSNAVPLLQILTEEVLSCEQVTLFTSVSVSRYGERGSASFQYRTDSWIVVRVISCEQVRLLTLAIRKEISPTEGKGAL